MSKARTKVNEINQTFKVSFTSNSNFNVKLEKDNSLISTKLETTESSFNTQIDKTNSSIDAKTDINNTPEEDVWYDEIIYYDGGGVEGYGD